MIRSKQLGSDGETPVCRLHPGCFDRIKQAAWQYKPTYPSLAVYNQISLNLKLFLKIFQTGHTTPEISASVAAT
jgi:hypothetical protein